MELERIRTLAIDVRPRQFGYAALEGVTRLVDWGVVRSPSEAVRIRRFAVLSKRLSPSVLVLQNTHGDAARDNEGISVALRQIRSAGRRQRLPIRYMSKNAIRRFFLRHEMLTKSQIAAGLAEWLALLSLADSTVRPLTSPPSQYLDYGPAFSPDGSTVAFVRGIAAWCG
jgi:hypothetical protein